CPSARRDTVDSHARWRVGADRGPRVGAQGRAAPGSSSLMPVLWAASLRHLLRHPAQLLLALIGLSVGVGTIIAVDIATASAGRAFQLSVQAVNGAATHQIVGGPQGLDERLYVDLRTRLAPRAAMSPVLEGYVSSGDRELQLVGLDPPAVEELGASGHGAAQRTEVPVAGEDLIRWLTQPGAVVMSA